MEVSEFARQSERLVDPMKVGKAHYAQTKLRKLPKFIQRKIVEKAMHDNNKSGFIVEPYCCLLFYELPDIFEAQKLLPKCFMPLESSVFKEDEPRYYSAISMFRVHTSLFWGARAEFYIIAENASSGKLSWIMLDYISDTIGYDSKHGLRSPDACGAVVTTTCEGEFIADINCKCGHLLCDIDLTKHKMRHLDEQLWIEGNTSIAYGPNLCDTDDSGLFGLSFPPREMLEAWELPPESIKTLENSWYPELFSGKPSKIACFPYAQHMITEI